MGKGLQQANALSLHAARRPASAPVRPKPFRPARCLLSLVSQAAQRRASSVPMQGLRGCIASGRALCGRCKPSCFTFLCPAEKVQDQMVLSVDAVVKPLMLKDLRIQCRARGLNPGGEPPHLMQSKASLLLTTSLSCADDDVVALVMLCRRHG